MSSNTFGEYITIYDEDIDRWGKEMRRHYRRACRHRLFETVVLTGLILCIGVFFMLLLMPQVSLAETAADNSNLKDEITTLRREILDSQEAASTIFDLEYVRARAMELGMQDPNDNQVVTLPLPKSDRLNVVNVYSVDGSVNPEAYESAVQALQSYYLSK